MDSARLPGLGLALTLCACASGYGNTYYVAKTGADANAGTAMEHAFLTIARGVAALTPGDTLVVGPGVYHEEVLIDKDGTRDQPITIRSQFPGRAELVGSVRVSGWRPVKGRRQTFKAQFARTTRLVYEKDTGVEYVEVGNLDMVEEGAGTFFHDPEAETLYVHPSDDLGMRRHVVDACVLDYGLAASARDPQYWAHTPRRVGLVIDGFVVRDYNNYAIFIHNAEHCTIRNCIAHHCRRGIFTFNAFRSRISGCEAFACPDRFFAEFGPIGMMSYSFGCVLENNVAHHARDYGIRFYGAFYGCTMRNNLAYDCDIGIHVKGRLYEVEKANHLARFSDGGNPGLAPGLPMLFERNVAHRATGSAGLIPKDCVYRHNTGVPASSGLAVESRSNLEIACDQVDQARFADPAWHDLRLQSDSPHRGAGFKGEDSGAFPYRGDVFFVSPQGDDSHAGASVATAWKTIGRAMARLEAGQTLYLLPGAYAEAIVVKGLRATGGPTIIRAHGKGAVFLDGQGRNAVGVEISEAENVLVQGLRIRNTAEAGVLIRDSVGVRLNENEIFDNRGDGVRVVGASSNTRIVGNTVVCNAGCGVRTAGPAKASWIVSNIVRDNGRQLAFPDGVPADVHCDLNDLGGGAGIGSVSGRPAPTLEAWRSLTRLDARSVDVAPDFADAAARDLRLARDSLCRGRGWLERPIGPGRVLPAAEAPIRFRDVRAVAVGAASADLAWSTRGGPATMLVAYGTAPEALDQVVVRDTGHYHRSHHLVTLDGLEPATRYFFRVGSRRLLEGTTPFHSFRYLWPERTPAGEKAYYESLPKQDTLDTRCCSFTTRARDAVSPRVIHVSLQGDDAGAGAEGAPLRTIRRACEAAQAGDRVVVHQGTYHETIRPLRSGLPGHPIVFEAAPGERVEINGKNGLIPLGADLLSRRSIVIRGFFFFGQTTVVDAHAEGGQIYAIDAADILVERCVFDGRMNYIKSVHVYRSRDVRIHNNIFVNHFSALVAADNRGTLAITHNSFLGVTINKVYAPRNEHVVVRGNLFAENLYPQKKRQYRVVLMSNRSVDMDRNCFHFHPENDERRVIDFMPRSDVDPAEIAALPEFQEAGERHAVRGNLDLWQKTLGRGKHSFIADPKWQNPRIIRKLRSRPRAWQMRVNTRFLPYEPFTRADVRLADDSPCRGAGDNGADVGAEYSY